MTLVEVMLALGISGLSVAAIVGGYFFSSTSAEQSALSYAASAVAQQHLEETRSARWDTSIWPNIDELVSTNFPDKVTILDLAGSGSGATYVTNLTRISMASTNPALKRIYIESIWKFRGSRLITNSIQTCRAPDQ
jgi:type II secretory pathway pseudopilin PulG